MPQKGFIPIQILVIAIVSILATSGSVVVLHQQNELVSFIASVSEALFVSRQTFTEEVRKPAALTESQNTQELETDYKQIEELQENQRLDEIQQQIEAVESESQRLKEENKRLAEAQINLLQQLQVQQEAQQEVIDTVAPIVDPHLRRFIDSLNQSDFVRKQGGWYGVKGIDLSVEEKQPSSGIAKIECYIDGELYATSTQKQGPNFTFYLIEYTDGTLSHATDSSGTRGKVLFDTTKYLNGTHTIMVKATDNAGNVGQSQSYEFVIKN